MLIFLIGYMGSGKSTIGKLLSGSLELPLIESDVYIEHIESISINEIFEKKGEAYFRNLESAFLLALGPDNMVVSTGGGLPCFNDNMAIMNRLGKTIYLKLPSQLLVQRLLNSKDRPLLKNLEEEQLIEYVDSHLEERSSFYNQCQLVIDASLDPDEIVTTIIENL